LTPRKLEAARGCHFAWCRRPARRLIDLVPSRALVIAETVAGPRGTPLYAPGEVTPWKLEPTPSLNRRRRWFSQASRFSVLFGILVTRRNAPTPTMIPGPTSPGSFCPRGRAQTRTLATGTWGPPVRVPSGPRPGLARVVRDLDRLPGSPDGPPPPARVRSGLSGPMVEDCGYGSPLRVSVDVPSRPTPHRGPHSAPSTAPM